MRWLPLAILVMVGCAREESEVETWTIVAELEEASDFPTLEEIRPYRDALVAHQYGVIDWKGETDEPMPSFEKIAGYHWAIVDGKPTDAAKLKAGDVLELRVQRMIDRSDLKGRYRKNSLDAFDLQEFIVINVMPR